jgi:hypothetical protein
MYLFYFSSLASISALCTNTFQLKSLNVNRMQISGTSTSDFQGYNEAHIQEIHSVQGAPNLYHYGEITGKRR